MAGSGRRMPLAVSVSENWGRKASSSAASSELRLGRGYSGRKMCIVSVVAMASSASQDHAMARGAMGRARSSRGCNGRACVWTVRT